MSTLQEFATMSAEQRADIPNNRRGCTISVPKSVARVNVTALPPSVLLPTHVELPPTTIIYDDKVAAQIFVHAPEGLEGAWQRLYIMTYRAGGRIFYRVCDAISLEAVFVFGK